MNTIGENIAILRKQKGLTQEALASAIGVSSQSISKWENNICFGREFQQKQIICSKIY